MLSIFKRFLQKSADRQKRTDLDEQIENAAQLRDMLGVARKLRLPVIVIVEVQQVRQALCLAGEGKECEWLYNMAAGSFMGMHAERATDAKFGTGWNGSGNVRGVDWGEISGPERP